MTPRIDTLRQMAAKIGQTQIEYYDFFSIFANSLVLELNRFLGSTDCVALCPAEGEFSSNVDYRQEGLGFEKGRYCIPLKIRLKNLGDAGELLIRIKLYFVKGEESLLAWVGDETPVTVKPEQLDVLLEAIYEHLTDLFSSTAWFDENPGHYQGTQMGFMPSKSEAQPVAQLDPLRQAG